jgi:hypothetical protein
MPMSLISGNEQRSAQPVIAILNFRGRFENSRFPSKNLLTSKQQSLHVVELVRVDARRRGSSRCCERSRRTPPSSRVRRLQAIEDVGKALEAHPVVLDVLAHRDVREVAP